MSIQLSPEQLEILNSPIDPSRVKSRKMNGGGNASYLETYDVIDALNRIFGFGRWSFNVETVQNNDFDETIVVTAQVSIAVTDDLGNVVVKSDVGTGMCKISSPAMYEMAVKGAVSDGLKRAARQFGNQFGNSLYVKEGGAESSSSSGYVRNDKHSTINNKAEPEDEDGDAPECEDCGTALEGFTTKDGKSFTAQGLAASRKRRFGKVLCSECVKDYK